MEQAVQYYREYGSFIKEIKAERNRQILAALQNSVVSHKNKIGSFSNKKISSFKNKISTAFKDIDLSARNVATRVEEGVLSFEVTVIDKASRFKDNAIQFSNNTKNKVSTFVRNKIANLETKFKAFISRARDVSDKAIDNVISFGGTVLSTADRFVDNAILFSNNAVNKVSNFKKTKVENFKKRVSSVVKDIDLRVQNMSTKIEKGIVNAEVVVINKTQRFVGNVVQFSNNTKNRVCGMARNAKKKLSSAFMSDEETRQRKMDEINERKKKIAELKEMRNQLLMGNYQTMEQTPVGRSRGILYVWMAALSSMVLMGILIGFGMLKR